MAALLARLRNSCIFKGGSSIIRYETKERHPLSTSLRKVGSSSESTSTEKKSWVSYGFNRKDEFADRVGMHMTFFCAITMVFIVGGTIIAYWPDPKLRDWAIREAHLQLRRREELGLPLIDANLVDPSKFELPTDEELGDIEIII
ncbi:NADH dehydrogenase [ubiquinone] 1 beta subcomplex subunit 11, mitochondrial [Orussus abietinus]|uniref:NADH dehydrogenase [ubiquinone] 1 beta subcomplex subunit 11, mitochondrial n=1 Tax=Orussus abietinus TaxID=222816 RepID=UPI000625E38F|nr:NADH dehydrogenase [ubiquinone] 1 beta subcomplex subunit 11, mitochondrial [Orussus abietinus]